MTLTVEQQQAAFTQSSAAVTAGAGTGKTHLLAERYLFHLTHQEYSPLQVVAVTFTEKAASELRARIRRAMQARLPERFDLLSELEAGPITTFHGLCSRICRDHPEAAHVPPDFSILDPLEGPAWVEEQLTTALEALPPDIYEQMPYSTLRTTLRFMLRDPLTAEEALTHGSEPWESLVTYAREQALQALQEHIVWQAACDTLFTFQGKGDDKLETVRAAAAGAMQGISQGENVQEALNTLKNLTLRGGSAKNWPEGAMETVKAMLTDLRAVVRVAIDEGMVTLTLGPLDEQLATLLPVLQRAFYQVQGHLAQAKRKARILEFSDLEAHALWALEDATVTAFYAERWKAYLVDEFQDTNPVQAKLLNYLTQHATLTIVGDEKQAIYGFRGAHTTCFQSVRQSILDHGGDHVSISRSFRTHRPLVESFNTLFEPLLGNLHQPMAAHREESPHPIAPIRAMVVQADHGVNKDQRQWAEARWIARCIRDMLASGMPVHDKKTGEHRPVQPGDVAILSRSWAPLEMYIEALQALAIPAVHAGGGSLLDTREAKDAWALLRFLASPNDNLALAALLRSPMFALSDRHLYHISQGLSKGTAWWDGILQSDLPALVRPRQVLNVLLEATVTEIPSRILQLADRLTGYSAIIGNLPGASRRLADWGGFRNLVQRLESGNGDVFTVMRRLKCISGSGSLVPRPPLEPENAIALMTIHAAKGLEWPVVIVPDLTRHPPSNRGEFLMDRTLGVALKLEDEEGELQQPALFKLMAHRKKQEEDAETLRLLYVALTRARDHVILTAADDDGGALSLLRPGLEQARIPLEIVDVASETDDLPLTQSMPPAKPLVLPPILESVGLGITRLPVAALADFALCPERFAYRYVQGHPGLSDVFTRSVHVADLTRKALALGIQSAAALSRLSPQRSLEAINEALSLARTFEATPAFAAFRDTTRKREVPIRRQVQGITFTGTIEALGDAWVLDYHTDSLHPPEHHRFTLWAALQETGRHQAVLLALRHPEVYLHTAKALQPVGDEVEAMARAMRQGDFSPTPSREACVPCPYNPICRHALREQPSWDAPQPETAYL